jgi:hypothetical protein
MALTKTPIELSSTPGIVDNSNATAITIDSSENVGIGVTPESHYTGYVGIDFGKSGGLFSNASGTNVTGLSNNAYLNSDSSAWVYKETDEASYYNQTAGTHRFSVAPSGTAGNAITWSEAMRIDASGNVLVGKTATGIATVGAELKATGELLATVNSDACAFLNRKTSDGDIAVFRKDGTTVGSIGTAGGQSYIYGAGTDVGLYWGSNNIYPMRATGLNDATIDIGHWSYRFKDLWVTRTHIANSASSYWTLDRGDGDGSLTFEDTGSERMRIDSSGNLLVGTTSAAQDSGSGVKLRLDSGQARCFLVADATTGEGFSMRAGGSYKFFVGYNGTINATNTTISGISDVRYKENIRDLDDGLAKVMQLQPRKFDWKEGKGKDIANDRGFIAQEFEEVFPDLIGEWKDPAPEGEEPYKSVSQDLIPTLVKAIQEQQTLIESLTDRIAALEE